MKLGNVVLTLLICVVQYVYCRKAVGDACSNSYTCPSNSICVEDPTKSFVTTTTCECNKGFIGEPGEKNCLPTPAKIGDSCHLGSSTQCAAINGTECKADSSDTEKGICSCTTGLVGKTGDTNCQTGVLVGESCIHKWECMGSQTTCNSHCICSSNNFVPSWYRQDCLELKHKLGAECLEGRQCSSGMLGKNADCLLNSTSGKMGCACNSYSITNENRTKCLAKAVLLGDSCETQAQCYVAIEDSFCTISGECRCVYGTVESTGGTKCLNWIAFGEECTDDKQCITVENSSCNPVPESSNISVCGCMDTHKHIDKKCHELAEKVGDKCDSHPDQCAKVDKSSCQDGLCLCDKNSYVASGNESACLPKVDALHEKCEESVQCAVKDSVCRFDAGSHYKTCQCLELYQKEISGHCEYGFFFPPQQQLGGSCTVSSQCHLGIGEHTECSKDGFCKCTNASMQSNGKCFIPAALHQSCTVDEQCKLGSNYLAVCKTTSAVSTCKCSKNSVEKERKCWEKLTLGEDCESEIECQLGITGPATCDLRNMKCVCLNPNISRHTGNTCETSSASLVSTSSFLLLLLSLMRYLLAY